MHCSLMTINIHSFLCPAPQSQAHEATFMQYQFQYAWEILVRECCYAEGYHGPIDRMNRSSCMFGLPFTTAILMDVITSCFVKLLMHARCRSTPVLRYQSCSLSGKLMIKPPEI